MSNSLARLVGPVSAGVMYQYAGITGCFVVSAIVYAIAGALVAGMKYAQQTRRFVMSQVPRDLAEGSIHLQDAEALAIFFWKYLPRRGSQVA